MKNQVLSVDQCRKLISLGLNMENTSMCWVIEENGEHHRWWYPVYKIFQVGERYFQVWGAIGLTESQEDEYVPQVAIEVEQREKVITKWVPVE